MKYLITICSLLLLFSCSQEESTTEVESAKEAKVSPEPIVEELSLEEEVEPAIPAEEVEAAITETTTDSIEPQPGDAPHSTPSRTFSTPGMSLKSFFDQLSSAL